MSKGMAEQMRRVVASGGQVIFSPGEGEAGFEGRAFYPVLMNPLAHQDLLDFVRPSRRWATRYVRASVHRYRQGRGRWRPRLRRTRAR